MRAARAPPMPRLSSAVGQADQAEQLGHPGYYRNRYHLAPPYGCYTSIRSIAVRETEITLWAQSASRLNLRSPLAVSAARLRGPDLVEPDHHPLGAAQVEVRLVHQRGLVESGVGHPLGDRAERDGRLQPRQRRAQA